MSTYVIGDIQGCYEEFRALLDEVGYASGRDSLWLVGDMVNRGPNNIDVLRFLMNEPNVVAVAGNHDLHFLAVARGFATPRGRDTITDLLEAHDRDDLSAWIRQLPLVHLDEAGRRVLVHAGLPPQWDAATCRARAREVETVLAGTQVDSFLRDMYGNEPAIWTDDLTGNPRLRLITNYFTRLRYCRQDGEIELESKETEAPPGYDPWFSFPRPDDYRIYFGHWAAMGGVDHVPFAVGVDTGCVWGQRLTAHRLEDGRQFSVPSRQAG